MNVRAWAKTDRGLRRERNEDSYAIDAALGMLVVCDGMGGHQGGATASRMAVEAMMAAARSGRTRRRRNGGRPTTKGQPMQARVTEPTLAVDGLPARRSRASKPPAEAPMCSILRHAVEAAGESIFLAGSEDPELHGMGTTLTALLIDGGHVHVVHAGDSRAYLLRGTRLQQLTDDHTWVAQQVRAGVMSVDEIADSPYKHVITRSVGYARITEADAFTLDLEPGDGLLACSDGLSNYVDGDDLEHLMVATPWADLPAALVALANQRGGDDNITVVAARVSNHAVA